MKLTFKDLKQQKFIIEADPSETIREVKEKIFQEKGWDVAQQKLIYSGKILQDANTIVSYNIEEKGFIVCMVSKPKNAPSTLTAAPSQPPSTPPKTVASTPAAPPAPGPSSISAGPAAPMTPSPADPSASSREGGASFNDPSALLMGGQSEGAVAQMEAMGFPRSEIDRAMRAAFYNPDRAIEYLLNGIPENIPQEDPRTPAASGASQAAAVPSTAASAPATVPAPTGEEPVNLFEAAAQAGTGQGTGSRGTRPSGSGAGDASALGNLDFLRNNPHFQQLRQLVQQQPAMLEPILQQVGAGNPQLAQLIGQNQEQFLGLLSEDVEDDSQLPPGTHAISVTEEERDAIERLCSLGFPRDSVIQAYFACDKNEELAANFLFEMPDDNDEQ